MAGLGGLSMEYLDALADLLEMNLAAFTPKRLAREADASEPRTAKRGERAFFGKGKGK